MKRAGILIGVFLLGLSASARSQTLSLSVSSGQFFPADKTYRDIYGNSVPLDLEARLGVFKNLGLAAGVSYFSDSGQALNLNRGPDRYSVRFRRVSFPVSAYLLLPLHDVSVFAGGGVGFHSYEENWQTIPLSRKGNRTKPLVYAGVEYRLLPWVGIRLALRYEAIKSGGNSLLSSTVDLGGLTLLGGISLKILP